MDKCVQINQSGAQCRNIAKTAQLCTFHYKRREEQEYAARHANDELLRKRQLQQERALRELRVATIDDVPEDKLIIEGEINGPAYVDNCIEYDGIGICGLCKPRQEAIHAYPDYKPVRQYVYLLDSGRVRCRYCLFSGDVDIDYDACLNLELR